MNNLNILYEDNHLIVVIKPAGILSQADNTKDEDMLTIIKTLNYIAARVKASVKGMISPFPICLCQAVSS